jgi:predicted RNase H-like HicB family nuclease
MNKSAASKYEVHIWWSDEDQVYVAEAQELPGCMAHGKSREAALANLNDAIKLWLRAARADGEEISEPQRRLATA